MLKRISVYGHEDETVREEEMIACPRTQLEYMMTPQLSVTYGFVSVKSANTCLSNEYICVPWKFHASCQKTPDGTTKGTLKVDPPELP